MSSIQNLIQNVLGSPPIGYEYLVAKTSLVLLVGFISFIILSILLFQRTLSRGNG